MLTDCFTVQATRSRSSPLRVAASIRVHRVRRLGLLWCRGCTTSPPLCPLLPSVHGASSSTGAVTAYISSTKNEISYAIKIQLGPHGVYTSLYMALAARTSLFTKTTV